ncbi:MAG: urea ABC transporter permease subunit UrtB [Gammaproteobacteria bacterium]|nr:urea ABC transporter permease subunit UrtB [Gammaproteobacteria bacterium]MCP5459573.1 urea ABC transporter permease subunit UrtB [Gammaproteobacteria bacterium]
MRGINSAVLKSAGLSAFLLLFTLSATAQDQFAPLVEALGGRSFDQKIQAVENLAQANFPRAEEVLNAMLDGRLYTRREDNRVVIAETAGSEYALTDAATGEALGQVDRDAVARIGLNNRLRSTLRTTLAKLNLSAPDATTRLDAVKQIIDNFDSSSAALLRHAAEQEQDSAVRELMEIGVALGGLSDQQPAERIAAIDTLRGSLNPEVRNRLTNLLASEQDEQVKTTAQSALQSIEHKVQSYRLVETVFFGLSLGSVLFLAAIGLAITFGVMGVINMAHGELIMLGAYTTYLIQLAFPQFIEWSLLLAIPAAFLVSGLFGIAIERGVIRFLYGRPLETLLATFGISLLLQQLVRSTISAQNVPVSNPGWMSGAWEINSALSLTYNRLYILIFSLLVFAGLLLILKKTPLGLKVRAVSQNRSMAKAMGIRTEWVDAMTFGLGSGIAGVAGVALSQLTNVGPNLGQSYIVDSFLVVVFGGVGNLWGTLVSAISLGVGNKFLEPYAGAVMAKILVLVFIILFIQKRPRGLFPQRGRAAAAA